MQLSGVFWKKVNPVGGWVTGVKTPEAGQQPPGEPDSLLFEPRSLPEAPVCLRSVSWFSPSLLSSVRPTAVVSSNSWLLQPTRPAPQHQIYEPTQICFGCPKSRLRKFFLFYLSFFSEFSFLIFIATVVAFLSDCSCPER